MITAGLINGLILDTLFTPNPSFRLHHAMHTQHLRAAVAPLSVSQAEELLATLQRSLRDDLVISGAFRELNRRAFIPAHAALPDRSESGDDRSSLTISLVAESRAFPELINPAEQVQLVLTRHGFKVRQFDDCSCLTWFEPPQVRHLQAFGLDFAAIRKKIDNELKKPSGMSIDYRSLAPASTR